jgi:hypothetical protein
MHLDRKYSAEKKYLIIQLNYYMLEILPLNKNVIRLIKAVEILNSNEVKFNLKIVGSKGKEHNKVLKRIKTKGCFTYLGEMEIRMN